MFRNPRQLVIGLIIGLTIGVMIWIILDTWHMERQSLKARLNTLEEQMKEKTRPVIHIRQATVYNGSGEVIVVDGKK